MFRRLSPIHKLDWIKTLLFVLHGFNDTNVPVVEAEQIVAALRSAVCSCVTRSSPMRDTSGGRW
jgi:dipeptidyl aminopeptidase/acylaminoacyl peptidase